MTIFPVLFTKNEYTSCCPHVVLLSEMPDFVQNSEYCPKCYTLEQGKEKPHGHWTNRQSSNHAVFVKSG